MFNAFSRNNFTLLAIPYEYKMLNGLERERLQEDEIITSQALEVVFSDYTKNLHCVNIKSKNDVTVRQISKRDVLRRGGGGRFCKIGGVDMFYLMQEIEFFTEFRGLLLANAQRHQVNMLWLQMVAPHREIIDYKWNRMLAYAVWEKIEVEYLMSWLSTLGGGFSALGEQFTKFAETAGKISLKQLNIGIRLGDPFLQARCKLYYSISLIQIGKLRNAKYIVMEQYEFAKQHKEMDKRLVNMCKGIWERLKYEYSLRRAQTPLQEPKKILEE